MIALLTRIARAYFAAAKRQPLHVATLRALRSLRICVLGHEPAALLDNPVYQAHRRAVDAHDEVFFLSHRSFLLRGLGARERAAAACHHYRHEVERFDRAYRDAVYGAGSGLVLWSRRVGDDAFEIVLQAGCDVVFEGGCSLVMRQNGLRTCVLSFSYVPAAWSAPEAPHARHATGDSVILVTRRHNIHDHSYQRSFNKAFDRATVGHMCFAALCGIADAQGFDFVLGIAAARHPSRTDANTRHLESAYDEFWCSLIGTVPTRCGFRVAVPMQLRPLAEMDARHRKRAAARRAHLDDVMAAARQVLVARLVPGGSALDVAPRTSGGTS